MYSCILFIGEVMQPYFSPCSWNLPEYETSMIYCLFYRPLASLSSGQTWILKGRLRWPQRFPLTSLLTLGSALRHPTVTWRRWTSHGEDWRTSRWSMGAAPRLTTRQCSLIPQESESGVIVTLQCRMTRCSLRTLLHLKRPSDAHVDVYSVLTKPTSWYTHEYNGPFDKLVLSIRSRIVA